MDQPPKPPPAIFRGAYPEPTNRLDSILQQLEEVKRQMQEDRQPGPLTKLLQKR